MRSNKKVLILVVLVGMIVIGFVISVFLGGFSEMKIGYVEDGYGNTMSASFKYEVKFKVDEESSYKISFKADKAKGSYSVSIE